MLTDPVEVLLLKCNRVARPKARGSTPDTRKPSLASLGHGINREDPECSLRGPGATLTALFVSYPLTLGNL